MRKGAPHIKRKSNQIALLEPYVLSTLMKDFFNLRALKHTISFNPSDGVLKNSFNPEENSYTVYYKTVEREVFCKMFINTSNLYVYSSDPVVYSCMENIAVLKGYREYIAEGAKDLKVTATTEISQYG